ncbi:MAG: hypothetical protein J0L53_03870 [Spirochaetes bacterium]|nr:hypothetical protein [Spirochaetota bacterium]
MADPVFDVCRGRQTANTAFSFITILLLIFVYGLGCASTRSRDKLDEQAKLKREISEITRQTKLKQVQADQEFRDIQAQQVKERMSDSREHSEKIKILKEKTRTADAKERMNLQQEQRNLILAQNEKRKKQAEYLLKAAQERDARKKELALGQGVKIKKLEDEFKIYLANLKREDAEAKRAQAIEANRKKQEAETGRKNALALAQEEKLTRNQQEARAKFEAANPQIMAKVQKMKEACEAYKVKSSCDSARSATGTAKSWTGRISTIASFVPGASSVAQGAQTAHNYASTADTVVNVGCGIAEALKEKKYWAASVLAVETVLKNRKIANDNPWLVEIVKMQRASVKAAEGAAAAEVDPCEGL